MKDEQKRQIIALRRKERGMSYRPLCSRVNCGR